jgi:hypothetical protein
MQWKTKRPRAVARDRFSGDPSGIRTRVTAVRGQRTRPLYDGAAYFQMAFLPSGSVILSYTKPVFQIGQTALKPLILRTEMQLYQSWDTRTRT